MLVEVIFLSERTFAFLTDPILFNNSSCNFHCSILYLLFVTIKIILTTFLLIAKFLLMCCLSKCWIDVRRVQAYLTDLLNRVGSYLSWNSKSIADWFHEFFACLIWELLDNALKYTINSFFAAVNLESFHFRSRYIGIIPI